MSILELNNAPRCGLVCVGSELLRGKVNTHCSTLSQRLMSIGLALQKETTVTDDLTDIAAAIRSALRRCPIVLVTGGLGPTFDDVSREGASEATGLPLNLSPMLLKGIRSKFRRAHYQMPSTNERQALLLQGAKPIENRNGTAPGQWLELSDGRLLILLPGPPRELHPMFEDVVLPRLAKRFPSAPRAEAHLHFIGVPESVVDHKIRPLLARAQQSASGQEIQFTILADLGLVDFDMFITGRSPRHAQKSLNSLVKSIRKLFPAAFYGMDSDYPLEKVIRDRFLKKKATLAIAESCTGGMLGQRLTDSPGSSNYFKAGFVTYSNEAKIRDLGVPARLLDKFGAVSREVALAMARGARDRAQTTWGLSITGIAGPGGATAKKPVGLVYMAIASKTSSVCHPFQFSGNRQTIRQRAALAALDLLRQI